MRCGAQISADRADLFASFLPSRLRPFAALRVYTGAGPRRPLFKEKFMKRFHVHISVDDIAQSTAFYSALFGVRPSVQKEDYAKWMLEEPRVNFAISKLGLKPGLDHLGIQVDTAKELNQMTGSLKAADLSVADEGEVTCCYARSEKGWVRDPQGIPWEAFHTLGDSVTYGETRDADYNESGSCCAPGCCATDAGRQPAKPASQVI
jgi:catechol 2,3-dioxygenase-like lactoylglutathione lyase family enzyme